MGRNIILLILSILSILFRPAPVPQAGDASVSYAYAAAVRSAMERI